MAGESEHGQKAATQALDAAPRGLRLQQQNGEVEPTCTQRLHPALLCPAPRSALLTGGQLHTPRPAVHAGTQHHQLRGGRASRPAAQ